MSRLGLARVRAEGEMDIEVDVEGEPVKIVASGHRRPLLTRPVRGKSAPSLHKRPVSRIDDKRQGHPPTFASKWGNVAFGRNTSDDVGETAR